MNQPDFKDCLGFGKNSIPAIITNALCKSMLFDQAIALLNKRNCHSYKNNIIKIITNALCENKLFDQAIDLINKAILLILN